MAKRGASNTHEQEVVDSFQRRISEKASELSAQQVSDVLWAMARLGWPQSKTLVALDEQVMAHLIDTGNWLRL